jgi:hypothetical protein
MRLLIRRVARAFRNYARKQGWAPGDYRVFMNVSEEWGQLYLILVAKSFPIADDFEQWYDVLKFVQNDLKDEPQFRKAIHLVLHTFAQVEQGGTHSIRRGFEDIDDLLPSTPSSQA